MTILNIQIKEWEQLLSLREETTRRNVLPVGLPDCAVYSFAKEAGFLSKREQRSYFFFFQGVNTYPQNLSIFLRDESGRQPRTGKQKFIKGVFIIYDLFNTCQCVVQINIPGNLRIFKMINGKKQVVSGQDVDCMYVSSVLRTMYERNLPWGRYYNLFHGNLGVAKQFKLFIIVFMKLMVANKDIDLGGEFQSIALVKGSHACSLLLEYVNGKRIWSLALEAIQQNMTKIAQAEQSPKLNLLLAQIYRLQGTRAKSLTIINNLQRRYPHNPYLFYYQAKYLLLIGRIDQALLLGNSIAQYNQFEIWILLAQINLQLKHFSDVLLCLNHGIKLSKIKINKLVDGIYRVFENLGKVKLIGIQQKLEQYPRLHCQSISPIGIPLKDVDDKFRSILQRQFWRLNAYQKMVYTILEQLRYRLEENKFQELLSATFEEEVVKYRPMLLKRGMNESMFVEETGIKAQITNQLKQDIQQQMNVNMLPHFLQDDCSEVVQDNTMKAGRNLSVIVEIESMISTSHYQQRQREINIKKIRQRHDINLSLLRLIQLVASQGEFEKAECQGDIAKVLPVYNIIRCASIVNNYYAWRMFEVFVECGNYKSILMLIGECLDALEGKGMRKIDKLPYWMEKYVFFIIQEKGLKYLNDMLGKLNFYDQAVLECIATAKSWGFKGVTF